MKKHLLKSLLVGVMTLAATGAWAEEWSIDFAAVGANYADKTSVTISESVATIGGTAMGTCTVSGDALNSNFVLQTGTTWLMRQSNGLYQGNGGGRAMGFLNCTKGQIITIVGTGDPNPSTNATLKSQADKTYVYTVNEDGNVKFTPARYLYFTSVSVEDPSASAVDYTVKYVDEEGNEIKDAATYSENPGTEIVIGSVDKASIYYDGKKYIYKSDDSEGQTVAADGTTVITVVFREAVKYSWTATSNVGGYSTSGEAWEGDNASAVYPEFLLVDGKLWKKDANNKDFHQSFAVTEDNFQYTLTYTETGDEAIFLTEAEDIEGATASTASNADVRCSMGTGAYFSADTKVTTLAAGKYSIFGQVWGGSGTTFTIKAGNRQIWSKATVGYIDSESAEFVVTKETDIVIPAVGNANRVLDLIYIQSLGVPTQEELAAAAQEEALADYAAGISDVKAQLSEAIAQATALNAYASDDNLTAAIAAAQAAVDNESVTPQELAAAAQALQAAVLTAAKNVLLAAIQQATAANMQLNNADLTAAIAAAQAVYDNEEADAQTLLAAAQTLKAAANTAAVNYAKAQLQAAIDQVKALGIEEETATEAIAAAQAAVDAEDATVESLQAAATAFETAVKSYVRGLLAEAISLVEQLNSADLKSAIDKAQSVLDIEDSTIQQLVEALNELLEAANPYAKTALTEAIASVEQLTAGISALGVEVGEELTAAIAAAKAVSAKESATTQEYAAALKALTTAALAPAKAALAKAIALAGQIDADETLTAALAAAQTVAGNEDATLFDIAAALQNLMAAAITPAKTMLSNAILQVEAQNISDTDVAAALAAAKAVANNTNATLPEVAGALQALNTAVLNYAKKTLQAAIALVQAQNIDDEAVTAALAAATAALTADDATVESLYAAGQALNAAVLTYAKNTLQDAIDQVKAYNIAELQNSIDAAQAAVDDENATIESLQAAGIALEAAVKSCVKGLLSQAISLAEQLGADGLTSAINAAKAVLANEDATVQELAAALNALLDAANPYAKVALNEAIAKVEQLVAGAEALNVEVGEDLTEAIAAAKAVYAAASATTQEYAAALQTLMNAALAPAKSALQKAITLAGQIEADETLTAAIAAAQTVADNKDATLLEIAAVLQNLMDAAKAPAVAMLNKAIALAEMLGSDDLATVIGQAKALAANEDATVIELAAGMKELAQATKPVALQLVNTAEAYMATFDGEAAAALADDFAQLKADIDAQNFSALQTDIQTLMTNATPYIESAIDKLKYYAEDLNNATLNADITAIETAFQNSNFAGMFKAMVQFENDFTTAATHYLETVKAIDTTGKEGVEALNAAIEALQTALNAESPKLMDVALKTRNLVLAVYDFNALNAPLYVETDLTSQFAALTESTNWTSGNASGVGYATWAAPQVTVNGEKKYMVENYVEGQTVKLATGDVMYQTISGLAPGTYAIELYGSAALTAGRSDMTTDFEEGDEASLKAVYLYAQSGEQTVKTYIPCLIESNFNNRGGEESIPTAKLEGIEVGEDGQIKVGIYKEVGLTNWHIVQLKSVIAQVNAYDLLASYQEQAAELLKKDMQTTVKAALAEANKTKKKDLTAENAKETLAAFDAAIAAATASVAAYANAATVLPPMKAPAVTRNDDERKGYTSKSSLKSVLFNFPSAFTLSLVTTVEA